MTVLKPGLHIEVRVAEHVYDVASKRLFKPGFHISRKDCKHMFENIFFSPVQICLSLYIIVMITSIDLSQK